jgi:hypothetical protein
MSTPATFSESWDAERLDTLATLAKRDPEHLPEMLMEAARLIRCRVQRYPAQPWDLLTHEDAPGELLPYVSRQHDLWDGGGSFSGLLWQWVGLKWLRCRTRRKAHTGPTLDAPAGSGDEHGSLAVHETIADLHAEQPWERVIMSPSIPMDVLTEREKEAIELHYGLSGGDPMTFAEIEREIGRGHRAKWSKLVADAQRKLRNKMTRQSAA